jgi:phosphoserine phosphatase
LPPPLGVVGRGLAITEAAMRGEITDCQGSACAAARHCWKGAGCQLKVAFVFNASQPNPGVFRVRRGLPYRLPLERRSGHGGFIAFFSRKARLQLDFARANQLEIQNGHLTVVCGPAMGDIGRRRRRRTPSFPTWLTLMGISPEQTTSP